MVRKSGDFGGFKDRGDFVMIKVVHFLMMSVGLFDDSGNTLFKISKNFSRSQF